MTDFHSWPNNNIRGCIYAGARGDWTTHQYTLNLSKASNVCVMISHLAQTKVFAVDFHWHYFFCPFERLEHVQELVFGKLQTSPDWLVLIGGLTSFMIM